MGHPMMVVVVLVDWSYYYCYCYYYQKIVPEGKVFFIEIWNDHKEVYFIAVMPKDFDKTIIK
jgi:hypothetical protein